MDPSKDHRVKYEPFLTWRTSGLREEDGIIVGTDISQEWLLPWWWRNYQKYNSYPVVFVDLGMSYEKKAWCKERGELIPLRLFADFVNEKSQVDRAKIRAWEEETGNHFWSCREAWFKKPLACLQTPFLRTLWIDLDCEVRGSIGDLFSYADEPPGLAMVKDQGFKNKDSYQMYNSGVICYRRHLDAIVDWGRACIETNGLFRGDQEVFSYLIAEKKIPLSVLSSLYNWSRTLHENKEAVIFHWHGPFGKFAIRQQLNFENLPL